MANQEHRLIRQVKELETSVRRLRPRSEGDIDVRSTNNSTTIIAPEAPRHYPSIQIPVCNSSEVNTIYAFKPIVITGGPYITANKMMSNPLVYCRHIAGQGDEDAPMGVVYKDIPPLGVGNAFIIGAALIEVISPGGYGISCGVSWDDAGGYFYTSNQRDMPYHILWEDTSVPYTDPHKALILLGGGGAVVEEDDGPTNIECEVVATLPPIPETENVRHEVFWGSASTIDGGTGDDQIWFAHNLDSRWWPTRYTTKNGTPGA